MKIDKIYPKFLFAVMLIFPFLSGGYYVFTCALMSILLVIGLLISVINNRFVELSKSYTAITFAVITLFYLISKFWAIDSSMAIEGFLKYLCVFLFLVSLWQIEKSERENLFDAVPISAAGMTVISVLLGLIPQLHIRFYDANEDLHGFFEYANAYAIFLLAAVIILIFRNKNKILSVLCAIICIYGIYASNSRAVWLISTIVAVVIVSCFIFKKADSKKKKIAFFTVLFAIAITILAVLVLTGYLSEIFNYINTDGSVNERYLYYKDVLLYSIKHPFGKGAYAFYFAQPQFQSAYYYAIDVHNDYLQIMIEAGIIPSVMFVIAIILQLFSKNNNPVQKFTLIAIAMHSAFDYDLQFVSIFFILTLCFDYKNTDRCKISSKLIAIFIAIIIIGFNGVIGISNYMNYIGKHDKSVYFYKNTPSMLILMQSTDQQQAGYDYANDILSINDSVFEANNVLSNIYAENERYDEAIEQMELVIEKDPRNMQHYRDYIDLCVSAHDYYGKAGENVKAQGCIDKILSVPKRLDDLKQSTDERGIKYGRKQRFNVGKKYIKIINSFK